MYRALLFLVLWCLPANGWAEIYNCDIKRTSQGDWIPTRLLIDHRAREKTAEVWDPFLKVYIGAPVEARVEVENDKRVTFVWAIEDLTNTQNGRQFTSSLTFRATLLKPSMKIVVRSIPKGYPNQFRGQGECRLHVVSSR